jgi:hypothetical protein
MIASVRLFLCSLSNESSQSSQVMDSSTKKRPHKTQARALAFAIFFILAVNKVGRPTTCIQEPRAVGKIGKDTCQRAECLSAADAPPFGSHSSSRGGSSFSTDLPVILEMDKIPLVAVTNEARRSGSNGYLLCLLCLARASTNRTG